MGPTSGKLVRPYLGKARPRVNQSTALRCYRANIGTKFVRKGHLSLALFSAGRYIAKRRGSVVSSACVRPKKIKNWSFYAAPDFFNGYEPDFVAGAFICR